VSLDFTKLAGKQTADTILDPQKIFHALPEKDKKYKYLRDVQGEVLGAWFNRRNERDLLLKMNTGSGKTVVGLLILKSCLNDNMGPAVYVAPDNYLVQQVTKTAEELGIETTLDPRCPRYATGKAVLVIPIHTLVNGKSKFGVGAEGIKLNIGSIIIDDAHACIATTQEQFTLSLPYNHPCYMQLFQMFRDDMVSQSHIGVMEMENGDPKGLVPVPYWAWINRQDLITKTLFEARQEQDFSFIWPLIKDNLVLCQCVFSSRAVEISPKSLPINVINSFTQAKRHIYMTATLSNDSVLVSDFNADPDSIKSPISPRTASDIGDRMILIPQELNTDTTDDEIKVLLKDLSKSHNIVVIVPSSQRSQYWSDVAAEVLTAKNIVEGVDKLQNSHIGLVVLVNKYDGIDLPDDACRILVIDGLPSSRRLIDRVEQSALLYSENYRARQIQRIEQGMGRGVRSNDDYCVVLLMGAQLTQQLNAPNALNHLTEATKAQIDLSKRVSEQIEGKGINEVVGVIEVLLSRNPNWVKASKEALIDIVYPSEAEICETVIRKRAAFDAASRNQYEVARNEMQKVANITIDKMEKGWYLQQVAEYVHPIDPVESQTILAAASNLNPNILKPIVGVNYKKLNPVNQEQAEHCFKYLTRTYFSPNEFMIGVNALLDQLKFAHESWNSFEESFKELAFIVGFEGQRPEKEFNRGPDVLWSIGDLKYLTISCKSEATANSITKRYAEEVGGSENWFKQTYDHTCSCIPVIVHPIAVFDNNASPPIKTRVITREKLDFLRDTVRKFAKSIADKMNDPEGIRANLNHFRLSGPAFVDAFTVSYKRIN
jgi:replicative superfamily II helicase